MFVPLQEWIEGEEEGGARPPAPKHWLVRNYISR